MKNIITEAYANLYYVMCVLLLLSKSIKNKIYNIHTHIYILSIKHRFFFILSKAWKKKKEKKNPLRKNMYMVITSMICSFAASVPQTSQAIDVIAICSEKQKQKSSLIFDICLVKYLFIHSCLLSLYVYHFLYITENTLYNVLLANNQL